MTSVTYEMRVLGVDGLPKDPFRRPRKFLNAWWSAPVSDYSNVGSSAKATGGCGRP